MGTPWGPGSPGPPPWDPKTNTEAKNPNAEAKKPVQRLKNANTEAKKTIQKLNKNNT